MCNAKKRFPAERHHHCCGGDVLESTLDSGRDSRTAAVHVYTCCRSGAGCKRMMKVTCGMSRLAYLIVQLYALMLSFLRPRCCNVCSVCWNSAAKLVRRAAEGRVVIVISSDDSEPSSPAPQPDILDQAVPLPAWNTLLFAAQHGHFPAADGC
jgi:hypothetical protein